MQNFIARICCVSLLLCGSCGKRAYPDYSAGSGFDRTQIDSAVLENLEVLGRVWGYVKYHHPAFSGTKYDLDFELLELLPQVAGAEPAVRNRMLASWIDGFGSFRTAKDKYDPGEISDSLPDCRTDIRWIRDTLRLGAQLSERLVRLRTADRGKNHYVSSFSMRIDGVRCWMGNACFENEKPYAEMSDPDYGYRLLSVFRFWNMVEYFFPAKCLTDKNWNEVLPEYIVRMAHPVDSDYRKETWRMIAEINDNHAQWNRAELFGVWRAPLDVGFVEDRLIVLSPDTVPTLYDRRAAFGVGDEIVAVNRRPVGYYISQVREFVPCSNENGILAATADMILRSPINRELWVTYLRNGIRRDTLLSGMVNMAGKFANLYKNAEAYKILGDSIGYIYPSKYSDDNVNKIVGMLLKTTGLVIDLRCYPSKYFYKFAEKYIIPDSITASYAEAIIPATDMPGEFCSRSLESRGSKNPVYPGNIVVLADERTQSYAETMVQCLQCCASTRVVGSQSAGADGNISEFTLPGGITCCFSGLGWYYPDGWCVQRQGVKIDCEVRPSIEGVVAGRDEVLEAAVRILKTKPEDPENL